MSPNDTIGRYLPSDYQRARYRWEDGFLSDEVDYLQNRSITMIKEEDKDRKSAEDMREKYERLDEKARQIRENMQFIRPGDWV